METLKLFALPGLLMGTWAVIAAGTIATLAKMPFPNDVPPEGAPIEERQERPEAAPSVSSREPLTVPSVG